MCSKEENRSKSEIQRLFTGIESQLSALRNEIHSDFRTVHERIDKELNDRAGIKADIAELRVTITAFNERDSRRLTFLRFAVPVVVSIYIFIYVHFVK